MKFSYNELKKSFEKNSSIGNYGSMTVKAMSKHCYAFNSEVAYIIFDDDNKLVIKGDVIGKVMVDGSIVETKHPYPYQRPEQPAPANSLTVGEKEESVMEAIDKMLKAACDTSWTDKYK